eukprot:35563-Eustigmatos_ZCMA.PRE.1
MRASVSECHITGLGRPTTPGGAFMMNAPTEAAWRRDNSRHKLRTQYRRYGPPTHLQQQTGDHAAATSSHPPGQWGCQPSRDHAFTTDQSPEDET